MASSDAGSGGFKMIPADFLAGAFKAMTPDQQAITMTIVRRLNWRPSTAYGFGGVEVIVPRGACIGGADSLAAEASQGLPTTQKIGRQVARSTLQKLQSNREFTTALTRGVPLVLAVDPDRWLAPSSYANHRANRSSPTTATRSESREAGMQREERRREPAPDRPPEATRKPAKKRQRSAKQLTAFDLSPGDEQLLDRLREAMLQHDPESPLQHDARWRRVRPRWRKTLQQTLGEGVKGDDVRTAIDFAFIECPRSYWREQIDGMGKLCRNLEAIRGDVRKGSSRAGRGRPHRVVEDDDAWADEEAEARGGLRVLNGGR